MIHTPLAWTEVKHEDAFDHEIDMINMKNISGRCGGMRPCDDIHEYGNGEAFQEQGKEQDKDGDQWNGYGTCNRAREIRIVGAQRS